jgi:hypothetical protein
VRTDVPSHSGPFEQFRAGWSRILDALFRAYGDIAVPFFLEHCFPRFDAFQEIEAALPFSLDLVHYFVEYCNAPEDRPAWALDVFISTGLRCTSASPDALRYCQDIFRRMRFPADVAWNYLTRFIDFFGIESLVNDITDEHALAAMAQLILGHADCFDMGEAMFAWLDSCSPSLQHFVLGCSEASWELLAGQLEARNPTLFDPYILEKWFGALVCDQSSPCDCRHWAAAFTLCRDLANDPEIGPEIQALGNIRAARPGLGVAF